MPDDVARAAAAGYARHLAKPFVADELYIVIDEVMAPTGETPSF